MKNFVNRLGPKILQTVFPRTFQRVAKKECPAQLHDLFVLASTYSEDVDEVLQELGKTSDSVDLRKDKGPLFPNFFDSGPRYQDFLRGIIEKFGLRVAVETGVAHGHSTRSILAGLEKVAKDGGNPQPHLHSIDIDERTKWDDIARNPMWSFHLSTKSHEIENILAEIGEIDLFVHDSDHRYNHQLREYEAAWKHLKPGGFLVSDDISWSTAFLRFCKRKKVTPVVLSEAPKVAGAVRKPAHASD